MIYTVPDFQNPAGVTLSFARRKQLIALANCHGLIVLEDTPFRHIRFSGQNLPTLHSLDTEGRVIHLGSFSTVHVPGLRIGWAVAAPALLSRLGLLRVAAGTQTSTLQMAAASLFLDHHDLTAHIAPLQTAYARKQEAILDAIRQHFPQKITVTDPEGRPFIWATFPDGFDATAFMRDVALQQARVRKPNLLAKATGSARLPFANQRPRSLPAPTFDP